MPIKKVKNSVIRLEKIAERKYGPVSEKTLFKAQSKDGKPNEKVVWIGIYAKSGASTVELSREIKVKIKEYWSYQWERVRLKSIASLLFSLEFNEIISHEH